VAFFNRWDVQDAEFGLIKSEYTTLLVPKISKKELNVAPQWGEHGSTAATPQYRHHPYRLDHARLWHLRHRRSPLLLCLARLHPCPFFCQSCRPKACSSGGLKATEKWIAEQQHILPLPVAPVVPQ
jgi:hypothetical protein